MICCPCPPCPQGMTSLCSKSRLGNGKYCTIFVPASTTSAGPEFHAYTANIMLPIICGTMVDEQECCECRSCHCLRVKCIHKGGRCKSCHGVDAHGHMCSTTLLAAAVCPGCRMSNVMMSKGLISAQCLKKLFLCFVTFNTICCIAGSASKCQWLYARCHVRPAKVSCSYI